MKIAICAGHHPAARGAINKKHNLNEHDEAMKVVGALLNILAVAGHDVAHIGGRLGNKINTINAGDFDLALDIHFNAGGGRGCEVVYAPHSIVRKEQAALMSATIAMHLNLRDRGEKEGWYQGGSKPGTKPDAFVSQTNCPAFIPEPLFIDNDAEVDYWFVAGRHDQIATAIADSIQQTFGIG